MLKTLEQKITGTIKRVMPATVSIVITKHLEDLKKGSVPSFLVDAHGMVPVGGGSGFIVREDGLILTNKHVINDSNAEYTVITSGGKKFPAKLLSRDPINDVAIMKIEAQGLPVVPLGDASTLKLGQFVIATGNALGVFKNTVSLGIVSGLSRSVTATADSGAPPEELRGLIQTDAAINVGNSGGPLVDLGGDVVGINAAVVAGAQSINFAIPINAARRDLEDIKLYGRIRRPLLGIRYIMLDADAKTELGLPIDAGALVVRESPHDPAVAPGSPADVAGIKEGDMILELGGEKLTPDLTVQDILEHMEAGQEVPLLILRKKSTITKTVRLGEKI